MKAFKAFMKPFEAPQRSLKIKINLIFSLHLESGREGLTNKAHGEMILLTGKNYKFKKQLRLNARKHLLW